MPLAIAMSEAHSNRFADDCGSKDILIGKLEAKLKEQDAQWEKDVAALSVQVSAKLAGGGLVE